METIIQISPVQFWPLTTNYVHINDVYVHLGAQKADCMITFLDSGQNAINSSAQRWFMDTGCYAGWGGDDVYFLNSCLSGLGLTPVSGWQPTD